MGGALMADLISVKFDLARFAARLDAVATKNVPFAAAKALTMTAQQAAKTVTAELPQIFDRPTPFTLNAITIKSATKTDLQAEVYLRPIQAQYLLHEEIGGTRLPSENTRVTATALVLPSQIHRDAYGNMPDGALKALRQAVADEKSGHQRRARAAKSAKAAKEKLNYVSPEGIAYIPNKGPWGGPGGYFMRKPGHHLTRLTGFEPTASYKPRFHYRDRVTAIVQVNFIANLIKTLKSSIQSSR